MVSLWRGKKCRKFRDFGKVGAVRFAPNQVRVVTIFPAMDRQVAASYNFPMISAGSAASEKFDRFHTSPRAWILGIVYWLAFLLVLEPGNIFGSGGKLVASQEILRITAATLLGTSVTPLILTLVRRFPVQGDAVWRHAAIQLVASLALSAILMVISCVLADWLLISKQPFQLALRREFQHNWLLVAFCIATLIGFAHTQFAQYLLGKRPIRAPRVLSPGYLSSLPLKGRGKLVSIQLSNVDWMEAQGNYLALHEGAETHLIRENLGRIETKLNPNEFARVHRGAIVSLSRVEGVTPLGSGDASLRLGNGVELRLSRKYRRTFLGAWRNGAARSAETPKPQRS
ncbi:MAG TPA: LytTR family DNA-binding domain-containing protein [Rhizomicrobium sp.]|nr:LytTR family DNA-binding domain-containing protein [Rhizomicrobium sp.]